MHIYHSGNSYTSGMSMGHSSMLPESNKSPSSDILPSLVTTERMESDVKSRSEPIMYRLSSSLDGMSVMGDVASVDEEDAFPDAEFEISVRASLASDDAIQYDLMRIFKRFRKCMVENKQLKKYVHDLEQDKAQWMVLYDESTKREAALQEKLLNLESFYYKTGAAKRSSILEAKRKLSEGSGLMHSSSSLHLAPPDPLVFDIFSLSNETARKDSTICSLRSLGEKATDLCSPTHHIQPQSGDVMSEKLRNDIIIECRDQISHIIRNRMTRGEHPEYGAAEVRESQILVAAEAASVSLDAILQNHLPGVRRRIAHSAATFDTLQSDAGRFSYRTNSKETLGVPLSRTSKSFAANKSDEVEGRGTATFTPDARREPKQEGVRTRGGDELPSTSSGQQRAVGESKALTPLVQRPTADAGTQLELGRKSLLQNMSLDDQQLMLAKTYENIRAYRGPATAWSLRDAERLVVDTNAPDFEREALGIIGLIRNARKDNEWRYAITT
eukprot:GEMP01022013.1.p1 GENE.GEMP01022013.1~~GEMP01022013.1.p1  ORF type:complete len:500 (+),score=92.36 GEMP01022013.1:132-1631(+)